MISQEYAASTQGESRLHSPESEHALIGAMIHQPALIDDVKLEVGDFYQPDCAELFELLLALKAKGRQIDVVTLSDARPALADGRGTLAVAAHIAHNTPSAANFAEYARIVKQRSVARRVIAAAHIMSERLKDGDSLDEVLAQGAAGLDRP